VIAQVEAAVAMGKREVVFLGQTVNAYRAAGVDFAELLRRTARVAGLERIRFTSPHPSDVTAAMIDAMASEPKVMPYLHLPLQSASDGVLAAMERSYTIAEYRDLLATLRARIPGLAVSTDLIAGFPGETAEDFLATERFLEEARYDFAYLFKYSRREGTKAYRLGDTVDEAEKGRRLRRLIDLQEEIGLEKNRGFIGREVEVLVEGAARRSEGFVFGKTREFKTAVFPEGRRRPGDIVRVRVESVTAHTLRAA
jgi:tRNA-2-methylthio-N6-dimethylallyladenosine synthase